MKNKTLNILKAFLCIMIVFVHMPFPDPLGIYVKCLARIAVPIFFMISGYYSLNNSKDKLKQKIKHILKLIVYSSIFYLIFNILLNYFTDKQELNIFITKLKDFSTYIKIIIYNDNPFAICLWFLNALLYCYLFDYITPNKKNKTLILPIILLICYVLLNYSLYYTKPNLYMIRNCIFMGLPFYLIGKYIHQNNISISLKTALITGIPLLIIELIETPFRYSELYISSIFLSIIIFILITNHPNISNKFLEYIGSNLSMYVYLIHPSLVFISRKIEYHGIIEYFIPIIVVIISIILSYILYNTTNLIKKKHNG